jgi:RNA-directed DNA polymerase
MLGIPTALDWLIAQAILQVLVPILDPDCLARSYGFRRGRSAHYALEQACCDIADDYRWVVNIDLEKCFDGVNDDMVMSRVACKVYDT